MVKRGERDGRGIAGKVDGKRREVKMDTRP